MRYPRDVSIDRTTKDYEAWMAGFGDLHRKELTSKHQRMAEGSFPFLRATFYDWAVRYPR